MGIISFETYVDTTKKNLNKQKHSVSDAYHLIDQQIGKLAN